MRCSLIASCLGIVLLLLSGCTPAQPASAAEVHQAWITALQTNDRQAAAALLAADSSFTVDRALQQAQYLIGSTSAGRFVALQVEAPQASGAGQTAWSIWQRERLTVCYRAVLSAGPAGWQIRDWYDDTSRCPALVR